MNSVVQRIAEELSVQAQQVNAAINLLDEGSTVPFIARYRKEVTGGLDDTQLRTLEERLTYLRDLEDRRATVLASIIEQGKLTDSLKSQILSADTKTRLEDLYLPYRPKRRTKAQIAREAGLEPLALDLLADPMLHPAAEAEKYLNTDAGVEDAAGALDGAKQILMETFAEEADLLQEIRGYFQDKGVLTSKVVAGKEEEGARFSDYFDYSEAFSKIPSHRALALFRGRNEGVLQLNLTIENEEQFERHPCAGKVMSHFGIKPEGRPGDDFLVECAEWAWKVKIFSHIDLELRGELRGLAEEQAIQVFASNLSDLLLASPAGPRVTIGLDPGLRTGVKVAVVDHTGKLVDTATIYPHAPQNKWDQSISVLAKLAAQHGVTLVAIGNGTASRETDKLVRDLTARHPELKLSSIMVSEAGASVYSASELAAKEFPNLDVSLRGAVSIARRLQDPLAELVKIDPKSIGVGQYQHDVSQVKLARSLDAVVEDCVNAVGVDLNTASVPLLARVSGLSSSLAENIVSYRDEHGEFANRQTLLAVPRVGPKVFEQAAGFLRIMGGDNPLDRSSVHPEAYPVVERILAQTGRDIKGVIGQTDFLKQLKPAQFTDEQFGVPTVTDIISELDKPGRDPRPEFTTATFKEGVETMKDLVEDMVLEGVVTNVTNFGAFVDIGVHQDGLVHISALADKFVKDPRDVVKAGDVVKVKVVDVDLQRKRIGLTMRLNSDTRSERASKPEGGHGQRPNRKSGGKQQARGGNQPRQRSEKPVNSAMGDALAAALNRGKGK